MDRRKFLATTGLAAISVSVFGSVVKTSSGAFKSDCETTDDILGPYYRPDAPIRNDLTYEGLKGSVILLQGKVYSEDCVTPVSNALVEIWHADTSGKYDNSSKKMQQRARLYTAEDGSYTFKTILPGKYMNGSQYRPSHIHYRISEDDHQELISQIYFQGDQHNAIDPWASQKKAESRILPLMPINNTGGIGVEFNIYLGKK